MAAHKPPLLSASPAGDWESGMALTGYSLKFTITIWVCDPHFGKSGNFQGLHCLSLSVRMNVIVPRKMQQSVDDEVGSVMIERDAFLLCLARASLIGKSDVAKHLGRTIRFQNQQLVALKHRKAEHICGFVAISPFAIERVDFAIRGKQNAHQQTLLCELGHNFPSRISSLRRQRLPVTARPTFKIELDLQTKAALARFQPA